MAVMGSLLLSVENRRTLFDKLQSVYDQHRFLDAYKLSADCWTGIHQNQRTLCKEMVFAGRLASRLGGFRLSRYLYRRARERGPEGKHQKAPKMC